MKLHNSTTEIFVPDGLPVARALKRITHLGIGAHQDDLEFMAFQGILECYASDEKWFGGVTCTNGSGSARTGAYEKFTDAQMMAVRRREQNSGGSRRSLRRDDSTGLSEQRGQKRDRPGAEKRFEENSRRDPAADRLHTQSGGQA